MSSTLRRRVRARMKKTGESYQVARRNYLKTHHKEESQPAEVSLAETTPSPSVFALAFESLLEVRPAPPPPTPDEKAAHRERLWTQLERALTKQLPPRSATRLLEQLRKEEMTDEELHGAANYLSALPRGYLAREQEWIAQQVRQVRPILEHAAAMRLVLEQAAAMRPILEHAAAMRPVLEQAAAMRPILEQAAAFPDLVRQTPEMIKRAAENSSIA
jgi:hypothetical protein